MPDTGVTRLDAGAVDLLVLGGGMAGLTAAARAAHDGARVLVVEVADDLGGSVRFAGYAWTAPSREVVDEVLPDGDPELRHALVDRFADGVEWIRSLGVHVGEAQPILGVRPWPCLRHQPVRRARADAASSTAARS